MSSKILLARIKKLADTSTLDRNEQFRLQREKLEQFYHDLHMKFRVMLNEMEGDLRTLKEKDFPKNLLKSFFQVWYDLIDISKQLDVKDPYVAADKLVQYVKQRPHRSIIDNLDFLIQHHMQKNEIDTQTGSMLQQVQVKSLKLLKELASRLEQYMTENPLITGPSGIPEEPKDLKTVSPVFVPSNIPPQEDTYIPPVKK
jgi:hypothetical protein